MYIPNGWKREDAITLVSSPNAEKRLLQFLRKNSHKTESLSLFLLDQITWKLNDLIPQTFVSYWLQFLLIYRNRNTLFQEALTTEHRPAWFEHAPCIRLVQSDTNDSH